MSNSNDKDKLHLEADEKHLLLEHDYDGLRELNNPLPRWWNVIFYVSVAFGVCYLAYYQFMGGPSLKDEFKKDYAQVVAVQEEFKKQNSAFKPELFETYSTAEGVKKGEEVFTTNCVACHLEKGKGDVGPNLTDEYWLVAKTGTPEAIYNVVYNGSVDNGMPAWNELISTEEIYQAVAYVVSLKNTNQPGGKAPQGEKVEQ